MSAIKEFNERMRNVNAGLFVLAKASEDMSDHAAMEEAFEQLLPAVKALRDFAYHPVKVGSLPPELRGEFLAFMQQLREAAAVMMKRVAAAQKKKPAAQRQKKKKSKKKSKV